MDTKIFTTGAIILAIENDDKSFLKQLLEAIKDELLSLNRYITGMAEGERRIKAKYQEVLELYVNALLVKTMRQIVSSKEAEETLENMRLTVDLWNTRLDSAHVVLRKLCAERQRFEKLLETIGKLIKET